MIGSGSQRKIGIVIKALLDQAEELDIINKNKIRCTDIPRQGKAERRYLTIRGIDRLLAAAIPMNEVALMRNVLLFTGLRPREAKGLKVKDLDPMRGRLSIRRDVDNLGNPDETGHVWTSTKWRRQWATICTHAHISGLTTYELRHTAASLAIAAGADVKTVQLMLGHASAATTLDTYAHLWETGLDCVSVGVLSVSYRLFSF